MADMRREIDMLGNFPGYLANIREIQQIALVEDEEIRRMYQGCDSLWEDGFIETASYQGIKRWESMLGIRPYPDDSLEERRAAVMLRWNQQLPYTLERLKERLRAAVGDGYDLYVRYHEYELELMVEDQPYRVLWEVRDMVRAMIPANLLFVFAGKFPGKFRVDAGTESRLELGSGFYARYNREFLFLDGSWVLDSTYQLNGYKELVGPDLYPAVLAVLDAVLVGKRAELGQLGLEWELFHKLGIGFGLSLGADVRVDLAVCMKGLLSGEAKARGNIGSGMLVYGNVFYGNADTRLLASGEMDLSGDVSVAVDYQAGLKADGRITAAPEGICRLTVENDLWYLDGSYLLDGTKLLDAEIYEYEL